MAMTMAGMYQGAPETAHFDPLKGERIAPEMHFKEAAKQNYDLVTIDRSSLTGPQLIVLECLELLIKKSHDYQNPNSSIKQAMYYPNGVSTIMDIVETKRLRLISVLESIKAGSIPNFESLEDSFKDLANYAAIGASWCRGTIDGQDSLTKDLFNQSIKPTK